MTTTSADPENQDPRGEVLPKLKRRSRGRPSLAQAAALRDALLETALQSFLHNGYAATSIEGIARESGVAKITIYRQFKSKEALFGEAVHRALGSARDGMHAALKGDNSTTKERLLELIEGIYTGAVTPRTLALLRLAIAEAARFPDLSRMVYAATIEQLEPLVRFLRKAHRTGKLNVPYPERTAMQLSMLAIGGTRFLMTGPLISAHEQREWSEGVLELVFKGLSPVTCSRAKKRSKSPS